jgi:hypothetical protein
MARPSTVASTARPKSASTMRLNWRVDARNWR